MEVLLIGAGVVGSVYGAALGNAGHRVNVLRHGQSGLSSPPLRIVDADGGARDRVVATFVDGAAGAAHDLVLVAVRSDQVASTYGVLRQLVGAPHIVFFGNNPAGHEAIPTDLPGTVELGFPGIGGVTRPDGSVEYLRIAQQATTLEAPCPSPASERFEAAVRAFQIDVKRTPDIDGWLAYHAVFVSSVAAALLRHDSDAAALAGDRVALTLMCRAIEEGFASLRALGVGGGPRSLMVLHRPVLRPVAVRYWAHTLRSPMGELCFAGHTRHAADEMIALGSWAQAIVSGAPGAHEHIDRLLLPSR